MTKPALLLVDADERKRRILEVSLRKAGFEIGLASTGPEAWKALAERPYAILVAELDLPGFDGIELIKRIKASANHRELPLILMTDAEAGSARARAAELGVDELLQRPVFIKEIVVRAKMLLDRRQALSDPEARFISGELNDMGVVDLIQTLELGQRSGVIHLRDGDRRGAIYVRDGEVIDAESVALRGVPAVYRLLLWSQGRFHVEFKTIRRKRRIEASNEELLIEGMQRLDQWAQLSEQLPPAETVAELDYDALAERLGDIPDEVNGIIRLLDGRRSLLEVIDDSSLGDLEALSVLQKLFAQGLLLCQGARPVGATGGAFGAEPREASSASPSVTSTQDFPELIRPDSGAWDSTSLNEWGDVRPRTQELPLPLLTNAKEAAQREASAALAAQLPAKERTDATAEEVSESAGAEAFGAAAIAAAESRTRRQHERSRSKVGTPPENDDPGRRAAAENARAEQRAIAEENNQRRTTSRYEPMCSPDTGERPEALLESVALSRTSTAQQWLEELVDTTDQATEGSRRAGAGAPNEGSRAATLRAEGSEFERTAKLPYSPAAGPSDEAPGDRAASPTLGGAASQTLEPDPTGVEGELSAPSAGKAARSVLARITRPMSNELSPPQPNAHEEDALAASDAMISRPDPLEEADRSQGGVEAAPSAEAPGSHTATTAGHQALLEDEARAAGTGAPLAESEEPLAESEETALEEEPHAKNEHQGETPSRAATLDAPIASDDPGPPQDAAPTREGATDESDSPASEEREDPGQRSAHESKRGKMSRKRRRRKGQTTGGSPALSASGSGSGGGSALALQAVDTSAEDGGSDGRDSAGAAAPQEEGSPPSAQREAPEAVDEAKRGGEVIPFPSKRDGDYDRAAREAAELSGEDDPSSASINFQDEAFFSSDYEHDPFNDESFSIYHPPRRRKKTGLWVAAGLIVALGGGLTGYLGYEANRRYLGGGLASLHVDRDAPPPKLPQVPGEWSHPGAATATKGVGTSASQTAPRATPLTTAATSAPTAGAATSTPTAGAAATSAPTAGAPTVGAPGTDAPGTGAPGTGAPGTGAPGTGLTTSTSAAATSAPTTPALGTPTGASTATPDPASPDARYAALVKEAQELFSKRKGGRAYALLKQAHKLKQNGWEALDHLAWHAYNRGATTKGRQLAHRALGGNPEAPYANLVLGAVAHEKGQKGEAKARYRRFLAGCPGCPETRDINEALKGL